MDPIDYSDAKLKFMGVRKHFFRDVTYYVTVFEDLIVMATTPDSQSPKYRIRLSLDIRINWELRKDKQTLDCFEFAYREGKKLMYAEPQNLLEYKFSKARLKNLLAGKVFFEGIGDLFVPLYQIGKGSSAKVYSAKSVLDQKVYAVKAIEKAFLKSAENGHGMQAFYSEVQILKTLSPYDSNFLTLKEVYEGDNTLYLVTPYLEGYSLTDELEKAKSLNNKKLPIGAVKKIMHKLLINLRILHSHRIIHRDLKPDNLMLAKKNDYSSLVLVDFGLATSELLDKYLFPKCGTPGYVAPEVLSSRSDQRYNCRVDIFSAGCIFYKMLAGHSLFTGQNFDQVLKANKACQIDLDQPIDGAYITEQSLDLLKKMLCKNPKQRITALQALQHPFLDENNSIVLQTSVFKNTNVQDADNDSLSDIMDEQKEVKINDIKRYSFLSEFQQQQGPNSAKRGSALSSGTFYQKDPLSALKALRIQHCISPN